MKHMRLMFCVSVALLILLAACVPASTPTPVFIVVTATPEATTAPVASEAPSAAPLSPSAFSLAGLDPGTPMVWVDGSLLLFVPKGEFTMGAGGQDNPQHQVTLSDFWIYRTKVTNRMYAICLAAGKCTLPQLDTAARALSSLNLRDMPVVGVDWSQADAYCKFVQGHLPTEAQWEKTARGPSANIYPWGNSAPKCDLLNFNNCVAKLTKVFTYPAGKSFYGALDMAGNAFEWGADWYSDSYYPVSPPADPPGPDTGTDRVVRDSSYETYGQSVTSATRFYYDPTRYKPDLGFRCVVDKPTQFAAFCQAVFVPGAPGQFPGGGSAPGSGFCPAPGFSPNPGDCKGSTGFATGDITGGETITSVTGTGCIKTTDTRVYCSGASGGSASFSVCVQGTTCKVPPAPLPGCPPGTTDVGGTCMGNGTPGMCPTGYKYDSTNKCCSAGPGIPYPGCADDEYYDYALGCVSGSPPPGPDCYNESLTFGVCPCVGPDCGGNPGGNCQPNPACANWPPNSKCPYAPICTGTACLSAHTQIDTPNGPVAVEDLHVGDPVWSASKSGVRFHATVIKVVRTPVPVDHQMVRMFLADGRELYASLGHPTTDGRTLGDLKPGDLLDGALVTSIERGPYNQPATYDLLPSGGTGFYWANSILIGSTLSNP